MSFLKSIVTDMLQETAQKTFVEEMSKQSGVPVEKLNEVFQYGMSLMTNPNSDPIIIGKSAVYKFLDEIGEDEYVSEGDVIHLPPHKQDVKHCTCPYDDDDDTKDVGTDPRCPFHGVAAQRANKLKERRSGEPKRNVPNASLDCKSCKGEGCKKCDFTGRIKLEDANAMQQRRWDAQVDRVIAQAMKKGIEPDELLKQGERLERLGHHKGAIYVDAAYKYKKMDPYREPEKKAAGQSFQYESDEEFEYEIYDTKDKKVVSKPSTNRRRLANRADKLDLEYGAVRYVVRPVK